MRTTVYKNLYNTNVGFNIVSTYSTIANVKPQTLLTNWFEHHLSISCWKLSVSLRRNHGNSHLFSSFHLQRRTLSSSFLFKIISTLKQFINWLSAQSQSKAIFLAASSKKDVPVWTVSFLPNRLERVIRPEMQKGNHLAGSLLHPTWRQTPGEDTTFCYRLLPARRKESCHNPFKNLVGLIQIRR